MNGRGARAASLHRRIDAVAATTPIDVARREGNAFFADDSAEAEGRRKDLLAPSAGDGVFCRTAPADKQRIIKLLADAHGDVTACVEIKLYSAVLPRHRRAPNSLVDFRTGHGDDGRRSK